MRETFTSLQTAVAHATQSSVSDTAINTYLKNQLNTAYRFILAEIDVYKSQTVGTDTTVANQQYYFYPGAFVELESVKVTIGSIDYNLLPVDNEQSWINLNAIDFAASSFPKYFFPRALDFGIWPIPQTAGYTITYTYNPRYPDMSNEDYTTGTVTLTNASATVTGSGTTFTSAMVGRWIKGNLNGVWYKITAFTSTTSITIHRKFEGTTASSLAYTIGESPQIPEEGHELLVYRAAERYYAEKRADMDKAKFWSNMFFTGEPHNQSREEKLVFGGFIGLKKRYNARSSSGLIYKNVNDPPYSLNDKIWATTIS